MAAPSAPQLAPPGAGLPLYQRWAAKYWILPRYFKSHPWPGIPDEFKASGERVLEAYARVPEARRGERALVRPLRGLEDSSRFWSAAMVLEHLVIVGELVTAGVETLAAGRVPAEEARIEKVKPPGALSPERAEADYRALLERGAARLRSAAHTTSTATYPHPWFGPLTTHQWACFGALHHSIHRQQLKEIAKGMVG